MDLPAVGALHLVRLVKVFEISAADQVAGWGRGHDEGVLQGG